MSKALSGEESMRARRASRLTVWTGAWLLLCVGLGAARAETAPEGAAVSVTGTKAVALGTFAEGVAIHPNREYTFVEVPAALKGLHFTSHLHKAPAGLACTVKTPGPVYLVLQRPAKPADVCPAGGWTACGEMDTVIRGQHYPWGVYRAKAKAGDVLRLRAPDRWGVVVAARKIEGLKVAPPAPRRPRTSQPRGGAVASHDEYAALVRDLANRSWFEGIGHQALHREALILPTDRDPLDVVLRRTRALLADLTARPDAPNLAAPAAELKALADEAAGVDVAGAPARRALFDRAVRLRRRVAFANPLLNFGRILFIQRHDAGGPFHMCDQYYGCNARPGGGLFVLEDAFSDSPRVRDLLADSVVENGRLKGRKLAGGSFLSPELSYDGRTILFAWTQCKANKTYVWGPEYSYHLFRCNADGSGLRQLTDGDADDFDPCLLPDGRIVFVSERRGGYLRCGRHCPTYTLFTMGPDGEAKLGTGGRDIRCLSYHETHEWHPSVTNDGMLVYTRWDYVDRDTNVAHHIWTCYPDGRDPRSFHGNYPADRKSRPWMEQSIRAIPGSHRFVATTGAHHGHAFGSLVVIDQALEDDGAMSQLRRLTPEAAFPEAETNTRTGMRYGTAWPLSESYYLCAHDPAAKNHGLYLVDCFGNRELLYRDASIASIDPIPLRPRRRPPVIPFQGELAADPGDGRPATMAVMNVYDSDFAWPADTKIARLRIVQVLPKTTPPPNRPRVGVGNQTNARAVLGTVPVEADGSAHFQVPGGKLFYFQALDERGLAVQSMRSATYLRPGQHVSCQGCHEPKRRAPGPDRPVPLALRRGASRIAPAVDAANPFNYARLVQPVLDRHCVDCHRKRKALGLGGEMVPKRGWTRSYESLAGKYGFYFHVSNGSIRQGVHGGSRSLAGQFGAKASKLLPYLTAEHYGVKLPDEDFRRIALWLDCNSEFLGAYEDATAQARGELVRPGLE